MRVSNKYLLAMALLGIILTGCTPKPEQIDEKTQPMSEESTISDAESLPTNDDSTVQDTVTSTMLAGSNAIFINSQKPGSQIRVTTLLLQEPGYVVIHRNESGEPGEVIGYSELLGTDAIETSFTLNTPMIDGEEFFAMLHKDDGDGIYELEGNEDPHFTNPQNGETIMMSFTASNSYNEEPQFLP